MAKNLEVKCRCADLSAIHARALTLGARDAGVLVQRDTFFTAPRGRLKLREFGDGRAELIGYQRADVAGARTSEYVVASVADAAAVVGALGLALGVGKTVRKRRHVLLYRHTRIHLDDVDQLGSFVELETVLDGIDEREGQREFDTVAQALGIESERSETSAYVDLLGTPLASVVESSSE